MVKQSLIMRAAPAKTIKRASGFLLMLLAAHPRVHAQTALPSPKTTLPQGGSVVAGQAHIGKSGTTGLTVTQSSSRAVIDWSSFSVGSSQTISFQQPNSNSSILNRVTGSTPSSVAGQVIGNGAVYLINPNGIAITPTGTVSVGGGFIASTLDMPDSEFMAGKLNFSGKQTSSAVNNAGSISAAPGGYVALIGNSISNAGTIRVPLGRVGLGAGQQVAIDPNGDGFLRVTVPSSTSTADGKPLIEVSGQIQTTGATVELHTATVVRALHDIVNVSGLNAANSGYYRDGAIVLDGGSGDVTLSGKLSTSGGTSTPGGNIEITGQNVTLNSSARLDASGTTGGTILIGGDRRGGMDGAIGLSTTPIHNAQTTTVAEGAVIDADGTRGAGGNVVVWSDRLTQFNGSIDAAGTAAGAGGTAEVSSHGVLAYDGVTDLRAANGKTGSLLLDPYDVTISTGADSNSSYSSGTFTPTGNSSVINTTTLGNQLASANVTVTTSGAGAQNGDITVASSVSWTGTNSLTLSSTRDININAGITSSGGALALNAGRALNITGATINTGGGNLTASGSATDTTNAVSLSSATINVGAGTGTLNGSSNSGSGVYISGTTSLIASGSGSISITGTSSSSNGVGLAASSALTTAGTASISGTSGSWFGLGFWGTDSVTASSGSITLAGVSNSASGVAYFGANTLTNSGAGAFAISGTSTSSDGSTLNVGATLTTSGPMTMSATSSGGNGFSFVSNNSLTDTAGNLTLSGVGGTSSGSNPGIWFNNGTASLINSGAGQLTLSGTSAHQWGIGLNAGGVGLTTAGSVTLTGTSTSSNGLFLNGANSITDTSGNLIVSGASSSSVGVVFNSGTATLTNSGSGTFSFGGTSSLEGIFVATNAGITTAGALTMSGTGGTLPGLRFSGGNTVTASSGSLTMSGNSTSSMGIHFRGSANVTNSGASALVLVGTSGSNSGLQVDSGVTVTTSGSQTISGISTSGSGVYVTGTSSLIATSGNLTLTGASGSGLGQQLLTGSSITNSGSGTLILSSAAGTFGLNASVTSNSGPLEIAGNAAVTQGGGSISATNLLLGGTGGNFTLNAAGNQIGTLAANAASVALNDNSALTVGTVLGTSGATTTGGLNLVAAGSLTLASGAPVGGASPVLAATGAFVNNGGSSAVTATSGSWLIYSSAPGADTFGSLNSGNTAVWNATYSSIPPGSVTQTGNRYLFASQPTLTVASSNASKTYGTNAATAVSSDYTITGYQVGVAGAFLGDTALSAYGGAPSITSNGSPGTAGVSGSPYAITAALGSLTSSSGYGFAFQSNGQLTVNPAAVTVTALGGTSVYGTSPSNPGLSATGLQNGESVNVLTGLSNSFGITRLSAAGSYTTSVAGTLSNSNYTVSSTNTGTWTVNPAALTITALNQSKTYGSTANLGTTAFSETGLVNSDTVTGVTLTSAGSPATATVAGGPYAITPSAASGSGLSNYTLSYVNGQLTVDPAAVTVTALGGTSVYGTSPSNPGLSATGLQNGESLNVLTGLSNSFGITGLSPAGSYPTRVAGTLNNSNYALASAIDGTWLVTTSPPIRQTFEPQSPSGVTFASGVPTTSCAHREWPEDLDRLDERRDLAVPWHVAQKARECTTFFVARRGVE